MDVVRFRRSGLQRARRLRFWWRSPNFEDQLANPGPTRFSQSNRDEPRNLDSEWVHDKYEDNPIRRPTRPARRYSPEPVSESSSAKLRVENLHYDLTEDDLDDLFNRIGPVAKLTLHYDRAGRSEGIAFVTYESAQDAKRAVREFDGANANGQPIRLIAVPTGPSRPRNPFDTAVAPSRPLADRITLPPGTRSRSLSPVRHTDVSGPTPANIDRYVPSKGSRSRSPMPRRREGGRPPGARRERGERTGGRGREGAGGGNRRPKKTQEELDAEMEDYWGGAAGPKEADNGDAPATGIMEIEADIEMAE